ncbi:MAG: L,D-transpeptidase [Desulfomonile tiedjei]|nr:L,D-transpeptidase [Desulfomonile tiedjei]
MSSFAFTGIWLLVLGFLWLVPMAEWTWAQGKASSARDLRLSHVAPTDLEDSETRLWDKIEALLSGPVGSSEGLNSHSESAIKIPLKAGRNLRDLSEPTFKDFPWRQLVPGIRSLRPLNEGLTKLASLNPSVPAANKGGATLLDFWEGFSLPGRLVGDPVHLFSKFVIEVDRGRYTVSLYGMRNGEDKSLLFTCRAGLGSSEYPTPRGTYYLLRIFDDHPIWIPPPDRDWAWGQMPSRSVYGGHMMPLFMKRAGKNFDDKNGDVVEDLDWVAPPMQMVDSGGYRVHGTDSPWSIGSAQSHGCIRLLNSSVQRLADTLKMYVGTTTRGETPNGKFITLARPVKIVLY